MEDFDIAVIGAGSGGLVVASACAQIGAKVLLIERARMGGECLNTGCVPSKTLIRSAKVLSLIRRADEFGLGSVDVRFDYSRVVDRIHRVIERISIHDSPERFESMGCKVVFGTARFLSPYEITVGKRRIKARRFVIATGSSPLIPDLPGSKEVDFLTNENIFEMRTLPGSMVVLGAGPIGVELGQAFTRFGTRVTMLQRSGAILSREDRDVRREMERILREEGMEIITGTTLVGFERKDGKKVVRFRREDREYTVTADEILCALGRVPNVGDLDLEKAGIEYTDRGIVVDQSLRTTQRHIYACGDVVGPYRFTHMASYQAGIIVRNAIFHLSSKVDYSTVPWVIFTDPEVARVGVTEDEARSRYGGVEVYTFRLSDNDRANTDEETRGFVKIICTKRGRIVGAHIVGSNAGEYVHEIILAMKNGLSVGSIINTIHVYPTLAEAVKQACSQRLKGALTPFKKSLIKILFGLQG